MFRESCTQTHTHAGAIWYPSSAQSYAVNTGGAARNTVRAYTICLDMTITQANYWLVYRRLANNLMFSRHGCPHRPETPSFANTHTQAEGGGGG